MTIEHLEKRFGTVAVEKRFITLDQFMEAMKIQVKEDMEFATHRRIGEILIELGFMDASHINRVLKIMGIIP